ncbi:general bacterial porin, GBP family [Janthinobacterium sp. CG_23.3]|uniref:porin n=1 Tax=unclassified Janthinobacterium TaxID=2610881 RepID=UPI0003458970|nr:MULTISPECIES: porin [unclassified Janthinobacterium]MEC5160992.1 GBP family porin [Janthinobacterium sp. CG_S6]
MKKSIISLAVLAAASNVAFAQSNVTIYGTVDAGIVNERGAAAGSVTKVTSGVSSASRLGFRGTEDLGSGLAAIFALEAGFNVDKGTSTEGGLFGRQAYVGLKSANLGTVTLGNQYTSYYKALSEVADPFGAGYAGTATNLFPTSQRAQNSIVYVSPAVAGFTGEVNYSVGEQAGSNKSGRQVGAAVAYANGPLNARVVYNLTNNDQTATAPRTSTTLSRNILVAANYDFTVAKAFVAYGKDEGANSAFGGRKELVGVNNIGRASDDSQQALVGFTVPVGPAGTVMASYIRKDDKTAVNADATQFALGYSYALSKRTSAYTSIAKINNKRNAGYTVGNATEAGTGDKAFNIGMRHSF